MRKLIYFFPLALLLAVVVYLSSQPREAQSVIPFLSRHFPQEWLAAVLPDVRLQYGDINIEARHSPYQFLEFVFRKSAHIILYTSVGLSLYIASFSMPSWRGRPLLRWLGVLAGIGLIAVFDEWNQSRVPMRSGIILDVWLDVIGGMAGTAAVVCIGRFMNRSRRNGRGIRISPSDHRKPQG